MTNASDHTTERLLDFDERLLDFEVFPTQRVDLSSEAIDQAVELSLQIPNEDRQWQTYLNVLALYGFEEWLETRATDLTINREHCSVLQQIGRAVQQECR